MPLQCATSPAVHPAALHTPSFLSMPPTTAALSLVRPLHAPPPAQETFAGMIQEAGFQATGFENILGGVVAMHTGFKLPE